MTSAEGSGSYKTGSLDCHVWTQRGCLSAQDVKITLERRITTVPGAMRLGMLWRKTQLFSAPPSGAVGLLSSIKSNQAGELWLRHVGFLTFFNNTLALSLSVSQPTSLFFFLLYHPKDACSHSPIHRIMNALPWTWIFTLLETTGS